MKLPEVSRKIPQPQLFAIIFFIIYTVKRRYNQSSLYPKRGVSQLTNQSSLYPRHGVSQLNSPLCLNMNAPTRTSLSPQLALKVNGWLCSCSRHLLPAKYLQYYLLRNGFEDSFSILFEHVLMNKTPYIAKSVYFY